MLVLIDLPPDFAKNLKQVKGKLYLPIVSNGIYRQSLRARLVTGDAAIRLRAYLSDELPTYEEGEEVYYHTDGVRTGRVIADNKDSGLLSVDDGGVILSIEKEYVLGTTNE